MEERLADLGSNEPSPLPSSLLSLHKYCSEGDSCDVEDFEQFCNEEGRSPRAPNPLKRQNGMNQLLSGKWKPTIRDLEEACLQNLALAKNQSDLQLGSSEGV